MAEKNGMVYLSDKSKKSDRPGLQKAFYFVTLVELIGVMRLISICLGRKSGEEFVSIIAGEVREFIAKFSYSVMHITNGSHVWCDKLFGSLLILILIILVASIIIHPRKTFRCLREVAAATVAPSMRAEFDDVNNKFVNRVTVCEALQDYSSLIYELCRQAGIRDANFVVGKNNKVLSGEVTSAIQYILDSNGNIGECATVESSGFVPTIFVNIDFLKKVRGLKISEQNRRDLIRFVFAHELIHARYHDPINLRYVWGISGLLWLGSLFWTYDLFFYFLGGARIIRIALLLAMILLLVIFSFLVDKGYWSQCEEFRADRYAMIISKREDDTYQTEAERTTFIFETLKRVLNPDKKEKKDIGAFDWLFSLARTAKWFFTGENDSIRDYETHPSFDAREQELKTRKSEWGISDYIRYATIIRKRAINGKSKRVV